MEGNPNFSLSKYTPSQLFNKSICSILLKSPLLYKELPDLQEENKRPELIRQNNLAIKKKTLEKQVIFRKSTIVRTKSRPKTLSAALNGPKAKICFTDFFSENMKRDFLKMGRLDAIEKFTMANAQKPSKLSKNPQSESPTEIIKNKLLVREGRSKDSFQSRTCKSLSLNPGADFKRIIGFCEDTRAQNIKLKKDLSKTTNLLRNQFENLIKSSSHTQNI